jgi:hypothetical protein
MKLNARLVYLMVNNQYIPLVALDAEKIIEIIKRGNKMKKYEVHKICGTFTVEAKNRKEAENKATLMHKDILKELPEMPKVLFSRLNKTKYILEA